MNRRYSVLFLIVCIPLSNTMFIQCAADLGNVWPSSECCQLASYSDAGSTMSRAIEQGDLATVMAEVADNNLFFVTNGTQPLYRAAKHDQKEVYFFLLEEFIQHSIRNFDKSYTAGKKLKELKQRLLDAIDMHHLAFTALHYAAMNGSIELVKELIAKGASVNIYDLQGYTPVCFAIKQANMPLLRLLCESGADISYQARPYCLLLIVKEKKRTDVIRYLVRHGAYVQDSLSLERAYAGCNVAREQEVIGKALEASPHVAVLPKKLKELILRFLSTHLRVYDEKAWKNSEYDEQRSWQFRERRLQWRASKPAGYEQEASRQQQDDLRIRLTHEQDQEDQPLYESSIARLMAFCRLC